jgi:ABC-type Mn2+/Zn2+ transport system ATPase subunit
MLELRGLSRRYGDVVAVDGLSFTVAEGQMFGFVGPNGTGKTTAMRIVLGVLAPDAGEVRWRGQPMTDEMRKRVGYLPEDHGQTFSTQFARLEAQQQQQTPLRARPSRLNTHQPIRLVAAVRPSATRGKSSLRSRFGVGRWL